MGQQSVVRSFASLAQACHFLNSQPIFFSKHFWHSPRSIRVEPDRAFVGNEQLVARFAGQYKHATPIAKKECHGQTSTIASGPHACLSTRAPECEANTPACFCSLWIAPNRAQDRPSLGLHPQSLPSPHNLESSRCPEQLACTNPKDAPALDTPSGVERTTA